MIFDDVPDDGEALRIAVAALRLSISHSMARSHRSTHIATGSAPSTSQQVSLDEPTRLAPSCR